MLFQDGIGLEISNRQVTAVYLKKSLRGPRLTAHGIWPLDPEQSFRQQMEQIGRHLRTFIDTNRIGGSGIYIGIPHEKTLLREITLPLAARENLSETLHYELDRYVPIPEEDLFMDFQITGEDREAQQLRVLLAAAKKSELSAYLELADMIGIGICGIQPAGASTVNLLSTLNGMVSTTDFLLVYGGPHEVNLTAGSDYRLRAARTLPKSETSNGVPDGFAKSLKALGNNKTDAEVLPTFLCWGPNVDNALVDSIQTVSNGSDCTKVELEQLPVPAWDLMTAYGLALRAIRELPVTLNLMPKALRKRPSRLGHYLLLALIALTVLSGSGWIGSQILQQRLTQQALDNEIQRLGEQIAAIEKLQQDLESVEARIGFLYGLRQEGLPALDILRELSEIIPESAWIRQIDISGEKVRLDGYADAASELIPLLDASPSITDVAFLSAITKGRDGKEKFRIGFTIERPRRQ